MILRCDSKGDKRFSAWYARIYEKPIELWYQEAKRDAQGNPFPVPKGSRPTFFFLDKTYIPAATIQHEYYLMLWHAYLKAHRSLLEHASLFDAFRDIFDGHRGMLYAPSPAYPKSDRCCQAEAIAHLVYLYQHDEKRAYPIVLRNVWKQLQEA